MNYLLTFHLATVIALSTPGQAPRGAKPVQAVQPITAVRSATAISYPEGLTLLIRFIGTYRLPEATGEAKASWKKGMSEVEIEFDELKPAALFRRDFSTYVLWIASLEGHVDNAGEFILDGNRAKLNISTPLQTFGMFITAEPHFLVRSPSRFIVLRNSWPAQHLTTQVIRTANIKYRGSEGTYEYGRETLAGLADAKGELRSDIRQALTAVRLAERAQADKYALRAIAGTRRPLKDLGVFAEQGLDKRQLMVAAHDVVRLAVEAQQLAEKRAFQEALGAERQAHADETARLEEAIRLLRSRTERARLLAEHREMKLRMEEQARWRLDEEFRVATFRAESEGAQRRVAEERARRMRDRWERGYERLEEALGHVVDTRETARGLVVSLPDILFDVDKSLLRPEAREVLGKLCGILLVARENVVSVEGHTDSVGTEEYNQTLSERGAQPVRDYLAECGLKDERVSARGFGEARPVADNSTTSGRQENRRVEALIQDATQVAAQPG